MSRPDLLIWIDLETTELDVDMLDVLEIGARATTWDGIPVGEPYRAVAHLDADVVLDEPVYSMHAGSGLLAACDASSNSEGDLWRSLLTWAHGVWADLCDDVPHPRIMLAGSGISHFDHRIIAARSDLLHLDGMGYRLLDVSVIRTFLGWDKPDAPHRALDDVDAAIAEWRRMLDWLDGCDDPWTQAREDAARRDARAMYANQIADYLDLIAEHAAGRMSIIASAIIGRVRGYIDATSPQP